MSVTSVTIGGAAMAGKSEPIGLTTTKPATAVVAAAAGPAKPRFNIDSLIERLLRVAGSPMQLQQIVPEHDIVTLCVLARDVFIKQPSLCEVPIPCRIVGDTHGQYADLLRILHRGGFPPQTRYLFLGDYVDRGRQSLEVICLLMCYKVKYPEHVYLLRGNHETAAINRAYGFYDECTKRYSARLWQVFTDVFNCLPFVALVAGRILCMHGGLSPELQSIDQLRATQRPVDPPNPSLLIDLMWADPEKNMRGWKQNARGASFMFGDDIVYETTNKLNLDLIVRAHQCVEDGYEFFADRHMVTVFSAPNYCGQFNNAAAVMKVNEQLEVRFEVFRAIGRG